MSFQHLQTVIGYLESGLFHLGKRGEHDYTDAERIELDFIYEDLHAVIDDLDTMAQHAEAREEGEE